jgi:hypothetical protein
MVLPSQSKAKMAAILGIVFAGVLSSVNAFTCVIEWICDLSNARNASDPNWIALYMADAWDWTMLLLGALASLALAILSSVFLNRKHPLGHGLLGLIGGAFCLFGLLAQIILLSVAGCHGGEIAPLSALDVAFPLAGLALSLCYFFFLRKGSKAARALGCCSYILEMAYFVYLGVLWFRGFWPQTGEGIAVLFISVSAYGVGVVFALVAMLSLLIPDRE